MNYSSNSSNMTTIWLIIFLIFIFTCVLGDKIEPNGFSHVHDRATKKTLNIPPNEHLLSIQSYFVSRTLKSKTFKSSSDQLLRLKRENQFLINNELANGHDSSNTFQPSNVWTQEMNNEQLADEERHLSSDIELPELSEEDDIEDEESDKEEKDSDYEDGDEILLNDKKVKKVNKNRLAKKKDKNSRIEPKIDNDITVHTSSNITTHNNTTPVRKPPTRDYTTNYIELISGPGNLTRKTGEKIVLRCSFEAKPRPKIRWLRNEAPVDKTLRNKYHIKEKRLSPNKFSTRLTISQLDTHDTGFYQCRALNSHGMKAEGVGILKIRATDSDDRNGMSSNSVLDHTGTGLDLINGGLSGDTLNLENGILPSGDSTFHMTQDSGSDMPFFQDYPRFSESNVLDTDHNQQLHNSLDALTLTNSHTSQCVPYKGQVCSQYLRNHTVIVQRQSQYQLEELLGRAFRIIANAANISPNCHRFTMPLLCFQSFHVCEQIDYSQFTSPADHVPVPSSLTGNLLNRMQQMQADHAHSHSTNSAAYSSHYTTTKQLSFSLKQLCRDECEILEHDICSMEFALSKIYPVAGLKSLLPNCMSLPRVGSSQHENCLRIGVTQDFYTPLTNHKCYLDKGETYRGNVNTTVSGKYCEVWSTISPANSNHPELSGSHNLCRNPKGVMNGPWCHVKNENQQYYKELCDVQRCSDEHFWIYYLLTPLLSILTLSLLIGSIYCAHNCRKRKPIAEGICLSANEMFAQQLHQQHLLQSNLNSLSNNSSTTMATQFNMTLPFAYGRQATVDSGHQQSSINTTSSKQSNQSLLSNVLNSVAHPGRAIGSAIGIKNCNTNIKIDSHTPNLELKSLLSNHESSAHASSHYALSSVFPVNITNNPISSGLVYYPLHCIRILTRVYPRLTSHNNQLENSHGGSSNEDAPSTHLKSSLNYQFYAGQLTNPNQINDTHPVVIRALKLTSDPQNVTLFAEQSSQLSSLCHENVIKMIGVAIGANSHSTIPQHFIIFEQYSPVNLLHFLQQQPLPNQALNNSSSTFKSNIQNSNNSNGANCLIEYVDLLQIAYQIAKGMEYLSSMGYVNGDLNCKNCYINNSSPSSGDKSRFRVKIGGLRLQNFNCHTGRWLMNSNDNKKAFKNSKDSLIQELKEEVVEEQIDDQDYFTLNVQRKAFPVRWLPPETLLSLEYSTASDIWSYGVTLYEIGCFCRQIPFQSYSNSQVVDLIIAGRLLDCPVYCEPSFYALMLDCWREVPAQRSDFNELAQKLIQLINSNSSNNIQASSSHNNWLKTSSNRINRVCSPLPSHRTPNASKQTFGEDKVNGWLLNANEMNGSSNYLSKNGNSALKTNTMNSSSTYASSYCNNQSNSPNYNLGNSNSTANNNRQVEDYDYSYDQPFVQISDLEASQKLLQPPIKQQQLTTFQSKPRNGLTVGIKHLELKNSHLLNNTYNSKSENSSKHDEFYENHYSKLTYENEETDSIISSNFRLNGLI